MTEVEWLRLLLNAALLTIALSAVVLVVSTALGLVLGLARGLRGPVGWLAGVYTWFFRGVPELVILFGVFFGPSVLGLNISGFWSAAVAFTLINTAYMGEIIRSGIVAIPQDQLEAATSLGMGRVRIFARIVVPQAAATIAPTYVSQATEIVKITSLASVVGVQELTGRSRAVMAITLRPFEVLTATAVMYIVINSTLLWLESRFEKRARRWH